MEFEESAQYGNETGFILQFIELSEKMVEPWKQKSDPNVRSLLELYEQNQSQMIKSMIDLVKVNSRFRTQRIDEMTMYQRYLFASIFLKNKLKKYERIETLMRNSHEIFMKMVNTEMIWILSEMKKATNLEILEELSKSKRSIEKQKSIVEREVSNRRVLAEQSKQKLLNKYAEIERKIRETNWNDPANQL